MADQHDIDNICARFPGAEHGTSWGERPTWLATGNKTPKGFVMARAPRPDALDDDGERLPDVIVVRVPDEAAKAALVESDGPWFTTAHFEGYNAVLIRESRLGEVSREELAEVLTEAWMSVAPKRLVKEYLADS